ncbi:hypothetical protein [Streptomyces sp. NPDC001415]
MSDLDFYVHFATRGDVLGASIGMGPADWEAKLGTSYVDNRSESVVGRDYGLLDLVFQEEAETWPCMGIGVKTHRLIDGSTAVPIALEERYGHFARRVKFDDLRSSMARLGYSVEPDPSTRDDIHQYRVSESGARIFVVAEVDPYGESDTDLDDPAGEQVGDVWSISFSPAWWSA